jgi:hypothetical protein
VGRWPLWGSAAFFAAAAVAVACTGSTFESGQVDAAATADAAGGDGATASDGGGDGGGGDAGSDAPSGVIGCFGVTCAAGAQVCCFANDVDGGSCATRPASCSTASQLACDDTSDCPPGTACCLVFDGTKTIFSAQCTSPAACGGSAAQPNAALACDPAALVSQCPDGGACVTRNDFFAPIYTCE